MTVSGFRPEWSSAPGTTIQGILERHGSSIDQIPEISEFIDGDAIGLLTGLTPITQELAKRLAEHVGGTEAFWLSREAQYVEEFTRLQSEDDDKAVGSWLSQLPLEDLKSSGWVSSDGGLREQFSSCLKFFDVGNISLWREKYDNIASTARFRTSETYKSEVASVAAWLRMGELAASRTPCGKWDRGRLVRNLRKMRGASRLKNPARFLPKLVHLAAECGVAVVVNRAPRGCRASGATRFISADKAMLLLSFRYLSDDHFWFTFFHEVGHLVLHDKCDLFLEGVEADMLQESEANEFATEVLIPPEFQEEFDLIEPSYKNVMALAKRIGIAPGIVVGQLQYCERLERTKLNRLKKRYAWK